MLGLELSVLFFGLWSVGGGGRVYTGWCPTPFVHLGKPTAGFFICFFGPGLPRGRLDCGPLKSAQGCRYAGPVRQNKFMQYGGRAAVQSAASPLPLAPHFVHRHSSDAPSLFSLSHIILHHYPLYRHSSMCQYKKHTHTAAWPSSPTPTTKAGPLPPVSWGPSAPAPSTAVLPIPEEPPPKSSAESPCTAPVSWWTTVPIDSCPIRPTGNFYGRWRRDELPRK